MSGFLLDTNCISELTRPKPEPRVVDWMRAVDESLYPSAGEVGISELPAEMCLPPGMQSPDMPTMERVGRTIPTLSREEMMALEPLYLRGSSAEEKAKAG